MPVKLAVPDKLVESLKAVLLPELRHLQGQLNEFQKETLTEFRMLRTEMKALDDRLTSRMDALEQKLTSRMETLEVRLSSRVENVETRMESLEGRLGGRMEALEARMGSLEDRFSVRMTALEEKVTTTTQIRERLAVLEDRLPRQ